MWPYWKMKGEPEAGVFEVIALAGYNDDPNDKKHVPIVILKSIDGYLNEAVPIASIGDHFDQVFDYKRKFKLKS